MERSATIQREMESMINASSVALLKIFFPEIDKVQIKILAYIAAETNM